MVSVGSHPTDPEQDQGFQGTDICFGVPKLTHVIVFRSIARSGAGGTAGNQGSLCLIYFFSESLDGFFIKVYVGHSGKEPLKDQTVCVGGASLVHAGAGKPDEGAG